MTRQHDNITCLLEVYKMDELRRMVNETVNTRFKEWPKLISDIKKMSNENIIKVAAILLSAESYVNQMIKIEEIVDNA